MNGLIKIIENDVERFNFDNELKHSDIDKTLTNMKKIISDLTLGNTKIPSERSGQRNGTSSQRDTSIPHRNNIDINNENIHNDIEIIRQQFKDNENNINEYIVKNDSNINQIHNSISNINHKIIPIHRYQLN